MLLWISLPSKSRPTIIKLKVIVKTLEANFKEKNNGNAQDYILLKILLLIYKYISNVVYKYNVSYVNCYILIFNCFTNSAASA